MPGPEEFADRYAGQPAEAAAEANQRAVDEAHWLAMEERLGAEREGQRVRLPSKPEIEKRHGSRVLGTADLMTPRMIDEGMAAAQRLHARGGPGYVGHADTTEGAAGLAACTGEKMTPIPEGALVFPCTGCFVVGPKLAEERRMANLGNATTRQLLVELKARGEVADTSDGRYLARIARNLLSGGSCLGADMLDYRTVDGRDA